MRSPNSYILATFIRDTWCFDKKKKKRKRLAKSGSALALDLVSHCLSSMPFSDVALVLVEFNSFVTFIHIQM